MVKPLIVILGIYALLAGWYSYFVPPFESPDEYYHFAVIYHLSKTGELPNNVLEATSQPWRHAAFHAPLYYLISARLIQGMEQPAFPEAYPLNPHAQVGIALAQDNQNFVLHTASSNPAIYTLKLFSVVLSVFTLISVYIFTKILFNSIKISVISIIIIVFNPQFIFLSISINNDNAIIMLSTFVLTLLAFLLKHNVKWWVVGLLGIAMGFSALAKASGLTLYPIVGMGVLWLWWQKRISFRTVVFIGCWFILAWLVIAGWWYWRNWVLYNDVTATRIVAQVAGFRTGNYWDVIGELRGLYFSFWGLFGWFNVTPPLYFFHWVTLLLGIAGFGVCLRIISENLFTLRKNAFIILLFTLYVLVFSVSWWSYNVLVPSAQGRIFFPVISLIVSVIAYGLTYYKILFVRYVLLGGMGIVTWLIPIFVILPAYQPDGLIPAESWSPPENAIPFTFREPWKEEACLVLWATPTQWDKKSSLRVTFYWQTRCAVEGYWSQFVHLVDIMQESCVPGVTDYVLAQVDTMPQGGRFPFPLFTPDWIVQETLIIPVSGSVDLTNANHLQLGIYDARGTFMRAFVAHNKDKSDNRVGIGRCAPETILFSLE